MHKLRLHAQLIVRENGGVSGGELIVESIEFGGKMKLRRIMLNGTSVDLVGEKLSDRSSGRDSAELMGGRTVEQSWEFCVS